VVASVETGAFAVAVMSKGPRAQPTAGEARASSPARRSLEFALLLIAGLLLPAAGFAAPITGDPGLAAGAAAPGGGPSLSGRPPSVGSVVTCAVDPDGTTTCAVSQGRASVCPERIPGADIERSYRRYDYLLVAGGCTLSAEYWQSHSRQGNAPFDDTWDQLGEHGTAPFFNARESYAEILAGGAGAGPYSRLARAYIAAELNGINGAPFPDDVARAYEETTALFLAADPARLDPKTAPRFDTLADTLEAYNAGVREPGNCPPLSQPFSAADVGKTIQGLESRDLGSIVSVDERYGRGAGVMVIRPQEDGDQFLMPDEPFTFDGARKAKFTTQFADCVEVATGQETTVEPGGRPSAAQLTSAAFLSRERVVRLMVAVSEAATEAAEVAPAAGPPGAATSVGFALGTAGTSTGGTGSFPSPVLPPATAGGGGGGGAVVVPNVIGQTVDAAGAMINAAGLSIGTITINEQRAMLDAIIGVASAQSGTDPTVVDQTPSAGTEAALGDPVDITAEVPVVAIPEPASLLLFATGLALIVIAMARRRYD
jgi:hypothetical protein